jgi:hypothetical protein
LQIVSTRVELAKAEQVVLTLSNRRARQITWKETDERKWREERAKVNTLTKKLEELLNLENA